MLYLGVGFLYLLLLVVLKIIIKPFFCLVSVGTTATNGRKFSTLVPV
jgi:hypothetical protein